MQLGGTPSDDMVAVIYGKSAGIFEKYGLDVQIDRMTSGAAVAAGVVSGALDFGKSSVTTVLEARDRGVNFRIVAAPSLYDPKIPYGGFIVAKDSSLVSGRDFNNQLVAVAGLGDIGSLAITAWVQARGGDPKTIRFNEIPFPAAAAAVEGGRVSAAEISNPAMQLALEAGKVRLIPAFDALGSRYLLTVWIASDDFATKHPDVVRAFKRAFAEAVSYTNAHADQTAVMMATFTGIPVELIGRMARATGAPALSPAMLQPVIDASAQFGYIRAGYPAGELLTG